MCQTKIIFFFIRLFGPIPFHSVLLPYVTHFYCHTRTKNWVAMKTAAVSCKKKLISWKIRTHKIIQVKPFFTSAFLGPDTLLFFLLTGHTIVMENIWTRKQLPVGRKTQKLWVIIVCENFFVIAVGKKLVRLRIKVVKKSCG